ncbi:cyanate permease [Mucilaginibacter sp. SG564]|nr:cyanate permease [Mucilaginibacter sp. SG564]
MQQHMSDLLIALINVVLPGIIDQIFANTYHSLHKPINEYQSENL